MTIEKTVNAAELTLVVAGRLDTVTAPELDAELKASLDGVQTLVLDFAALEYLSSAGLRILLVTQRKMNKQGKMIVKGANETVRDIFDVTGFSTILTLE